MYNEFKIEDVTVHGGKISYSYKIEGEWEKYFSPKRRSEISYDIDISAVPKSVLVLPLLCNILPIAWLCDAQICMETLDQDFYDHVEEIKSGYQKMYPMLTFAGDIKAELAQNRPHGQKGCSLSGCFFSGGADAYTTLFRHLEEAPCLFTIWGADVGLEDKVGWDSVNSHVNNVAQQFGLKYVAIESDFRLLINEGVLNKLIRETNDGWWHGFQHGIAILAHAAPVAYVLGLKTVYIASSFLSSMKGQYTCASDPSIDEHVHFCGCRVVHDGYELSRQEKIRYLMEQSRKRGSKVKLRVCWEISGGKNCSKCEKCYRTILEIISEGGDPNEWGFVWNDGAIRRCKRAIRNEIVIPQYNWDQFYPVIQKRMEENQSMIKDIDKYRWLQKTDFSRINDAPIKKISNTILARSFKKAIHKIKRKHRK